ncbi:hypothetical protein [Paenarthrobacter sp. NPDC089316]|uniref:hypothetical protein n=1 Tax=unclassified Paenarthrobacter TaxID=2634190 RepID=UPI00343DFAF2
MANQMSLVQNLSELRNKVGSGHGKAQHPAVWSHPRPFSLWTQPTHSHGSSQAEEPSTRFPVRPTRSKNPVNCPKRYAVAVPLP